jgi:hypothetical protein
VLDQADGLALLGELTRGRSVEPEAARSVVELSGGLPLAIRVAAGRLASRPDLPATTYVERLASRRLDELELGDLAVRACIRTSYDALLTDGTDVDLLAARAFRMLGLLHVPNVTPWVVAAMLGEPEPGVARAALDRLVDAQLVEPVADGRYQLHDLVRLLAAERAESEDRPAEREEAVVRAIAFYTTALWQATATLRPSRPLVFGEPSKVHRMALPQFGEQVHARMWIDDEVPSLVAVLEQATGLAADVGQMIRLIGFDLWNSLDPRCEWHTAHRVSRLLLQTGERRRNLDLAACGRLLHGRSEACLGNYESAIHHLERARDLFRDLGNQIGMAVSLNGLGVVHARLRDHVRALARFADALDLAVSHDLLGLASSALMNMSVSYAALGRLDRAAAAAERSIAVVGDLKCGAYNGVFVNLAVIHCLQDEDLEALRWVDEAVLLHRRDGDRMRACEAFVVRSVVYLRLGRAADSRADVETALLLARASGYRSAAAVALRQQSRVLAASGRTTEAAHVGALAAEADAQLTGVFRDPLLELLVMRTAEPAPGQRWETRDGASAGTRPG